MVLFTENAPGGTKDEPPALRYRFNSASVAETEMLGTGLAEIVRHHALTASPEKPVLRIGLHGSGEIGKSTLAKGMMDAIEDRQRIESGPHQSGREQAVWHSPTAGWIRHYDALCREKFSLRSYRENDTGCCRPTRIDIVEHPYLDIHDTDFQCVVSIGRLDTGSEIRLVTVTLPHAFAGNPGLQKFLEKTKPLTHIPRRRRVA